MVDGRGHRFGGDWTEVKLGILASYLQSYTTALKHQHFETLYIDAFAGTGYRTPRSAKSGQPDLPALARRERRGLLDGSARKALQVDPPFDRYVFIDRDPKHVEELERLARASPHLHIEPMQGDANAVVRGLCGESWQGRRGVLFLDPYGMQVEWSTLEAVAATRAIDLWLLWPFGIGLNRLLVRDGDIPEGWRRRISTMLGTDDWTQHLYQTPPPGGAEQLDLFGDGTQTEEERVEKVSMDRLAAYMLERLDTIFAGVAENPAWLHNSSHCPLYLFCFAVGNPSPKARKLALKIAGDILSKV